MHLDDLAQMDVGELQEVVTRASALLEVKNDGVDEARQIHNIIADEVPNTPHYSAIKRSRHYKQFLNNLDLFSETIRMLKPRGRLEELAAKRKLIQILIRWMHRKNIPVSHRTICQNMDKLVGVLDGQFPGYREAGLLRTVLAR
jgi:hypothetical protein